MSGTPACHARLPTRVEALRAQSPFNKILPDPFQRLWQELALPPGASRPPITEQEVACLMRDRVALVDGTIGT